RSGPTGTIGYACPPSDDRSRVVAHCGARRCFRRGPSRGTGSGWIGSWAARRDLLLRIPVAQADLERVAEFAMAIDRGSSPRRARWSNERQPRAEAHGLADLPPPRRALSGRAFAILQRRHSNDPVQRSVTPALRAPTGRLRA